MNFSPPIASRRRQAGSVLILVLWVAFGLVAISLYFAHSMSVELQAADNRVAAMEAEQAIAGAAIYVSNILANLQSPNTLPSPVNFHTAAVRVGNARFWLIGRDTNFIQNTAAPEHPFWGLVDEASKLNLNTADTNQLLWLPQVTTDLAESIYEWRTNTGLPTDIYSTLPIAYTAKHTNYETVDELRLVYGMNLDYLYGEDANLNGILDPNENDGDDLPPHDNKDSRLDSGILDFVTVWTHEPNVISNGISRVAVTDLTTLSNFFATNFPALKPTWSAFATTPPTNVLDFYVRSQMSASDFQEAEPFLMNAQTNGLVNVNTATATALSCVLNSTNLAAQILNYRQSTPPVVASITWVKDAVGSDQTTINEIGQYLTAFTFQYTADVAAVGHNGRGYRRVRFVFDTSSGVPQIIYRQDLTHLGWALGKTVRDELALNN